MIGPSNYLFARNMPRRIRDAQFGILADMAALAAVILEEVEARRPVTEPGL